MDEFFKFVCLFFFFSSPRFRTPPFVFARVRPDSRRPENAERGARAKIAGRLSKRILIITIAPLASVGPRNRASPDFADREFFSPRRPSRVDDNRRRCTRTTRTVRFFRPAKCRSRRPEFWTSVGRFITNERGFETRRRDAPAENVRPRPTPPVGSSRTRDNRISGGGREIRAVRPPIVGYFDCIERATFSVRRAF